MLLFLFYISIFTVAVGASVPHNEEHFIGSHHHEYDSQQMFGEDSKAFDQMSVEEKKTKLGEIFHKIDQNSDGLVDTDELKSYIKKVQSDYIVKDAERHWNHTGRPDVMNLTYYIFNTYGLHDNETMDNETRNMIDRDKKRWQAADLDQNGELTFDEFKIFIHPEDHPHMKKIVIEESFADIDKDRDGKIFIDEYIADMYVVGEGKEPEWVVQEREHFKEYRDVDKNGYLDIEELGKWLMPDEYDNAEAEAAHLTRECDIDKDGHLSKEEMLDRIDIFTGSQVTDYGNAFNTPDHDEL